MVEISSILLFKRCQVMLGLQDGISRVLMGTVEYVDCLHEVRDIHKC